MEKICHALCNSYVSVVLYRIFVVQLCFTVTCFKGNTVIHLLAESCIWKSSVYFSKKQQALLWLASITEVSQTIYWFTCQAPKFLHFGFLQYRLYKQDVTC